MRKVGYLLYLWMSGIVLSCGDEEFVPVEAISKYCLERGNTEDFCTQWVSDLDVMESEQSIQLGKTSQIPKFKKIGLSTEQIPEAFDEFLALQGTKLTQSLAAAGGSTTVVSAKETKDDGTERLQGKSVVPTADIEENTKEFVVTVAQDLRTYKGPNDYSAQDVTMLNILEPYEVVKRQDVLTEDNQKKTWVKLLDKYGTEKGWIEQELVYSWNNRHALEPNLGLDEDLVVPGYCSEDDVAKYLNGVSEPCIQFDTQTVLRQGSRSPFLVVDGKKYPTQSGDETTFLQVLVPTLYSNMVPLRAGVGEGESSATAGLAEVIVFIDASSSMTDEIRAVSKSIANTLASLESNPNYDIRVMVIAYRDIAEDPKCQPVESIVDENGKPKWVSPGEAVTFLNTVETCRTLDDPEALWDAMYALRDVKTIGGAKRALIVAGDAPSWNQTRGTTIFGRKVPANISNTKVLREISSTLGRSSLFIGVLVENGIQNTFNQLQSRIPFTSKQILSVSSSTGVEAQMTARLDDYLRDLSSNVAAEESCHRSIRLSEEDTTRQIPLFCGLADDQDFSRRVADLVAQSGLADDSIVIRKVWIESSEATQDVILLSKLEATQMAQSFRSIGEKMMGEGEPCRQLGPSVWGEVISAVTGVSVTIEQDSQVNVSDFLHRYWKIQSGRESLLRIQPGEIMSMSSEECATLGRRLTKAEQQVSKRLNQSKTLDQYIWLPLKYLP